MEKALKCIKNNKFFNKLFITKDRNLIFSVVALLLCVILLGATAFSWIESKSSLVIKGYQLPISDNLNYRFEIIEESEYYIDLSTYFRPTAFYQFAQASSWNGVDFYFKKDDTSSVSESTLYRKGDTTDFHTGYYNIDFQINNNLGASCNYYFASSEMFTVEGEGLADNVKTAAQNAFRIAVSTGTNNTSATIYSNEEAGKEAEYDAVSGTASNAVTYIKATGLAKSNYVYSTRNKSSNECVFTSIYDGSENTVDTIVNIKIWFEEKDPSYQALELDEKQSLLGATVSINLKLMNAASDMNAIHFYDYTFDDYGTPVTEGDTTDEKMYFCYKKSDNETKFFEMKHETPVNEAAYWITYDEENNKNATVSQLVLDDISSDPAKAYFFYGTLNASGDPVIDYKWQLDEATKPKSNNDGVYAYNALSVSATTATDKTYYEGYGLWSDTEIRLWHFKDLTTYATENPYNADGHRLVDKSENNQLYINDSGTADAKSTKMYYDEEKTLWKGYYPVTETPNFLFTKTKKLETPAIVWKAIEPQTDTNGEYVYTALGYTNDGLPTSLTNANGFGVWTEVEKITFSTELVDASVNHNLRYKIGVHGSGTENYYYMAKANDNLHWFAYVPVDSGNSIDTYLSFKRYDSFNSNGHAGEWNTNKAVRDSSSIFYATDMSTTTSNGQWHIGVVVDGSAFGVVNDVLTTVNGAKLEYTVDGTNYKEMIQLDNFRWFTEDFPSTVESITYRWTTYVDPTDSKKNTTFLYGHSLADGIYFNITE
ncbi:MAG: hypothetical protein IJ433_01175 [Ruminococcus sp.]|nr:hypothetical protein [Ruminococcus sp.]